MKPEEAHSEQMMERLEMASPKCEHTWAHTGFTCDMIQRSDGTNWFGRKDIYACTRCFTLWSVDQDPMILPIGELPWWYVPNLK